MSTAPPLSSTRRMLRGMLHFQPPTPRRWLFALRASACMGAPIVAGALAGDVPAGLMAGIGGFTALYGAGRPYLSRARHLAVIAVAFALAVGLGLWAGTTAWATVVMVALIAMLATWLGNALQIGPPGAYMFALACAAGTAMPAAHLSPLHAATLVLAGGGFAWLVHMGGALFLPHGPERSAVSVAGAAVIDYVAAIGSAREGQARHRAAFTLHRAWSVLVSQQPAHARANGTLGRLRTLNRELHLRFAEAMGAASRQSPLPTGLRDDLHRLLAQIRDPRELPGSTTDAIPLGHPGVRAVLLEALQPGSNARRVILRVGVAAVVAGALGAAIHLDRAYWAVAAAVLMLHQGFDWLRMLQRSIERLLGTWVGLLVAGAIIVAHPQGLWIALVVMALQFTIEMVVVRNYTLAVVFITGAALTIASGGQPVASPAAYLLARGVDTLAGCVVALLVFRLIPPRASTAAIPAQLVHALRAVDAVIVHLAAGSVTTPAARHTRRQLQHASFALAQAHEESLVASPRQRRTAEHNWPAIAATERLAYRTLSACWSLERHGDDATRQSTAGPSMFGDDGEARVHQALDVLADAVRDGGTPPPLPELPHVLEAELVNLRECLVRKPQAHPPG
ncbi:FUSC family protein [Lysobacter sp. F6437]|uniref:FUSC family protein n=1 Tax=Lysobacter sp. F6437 TaxID=3459296 RepID=UPI00403E2B74